MKTFNIIKAIEIISDSWQEVKPSCNNGFWRKIWSEFINRIWVAETKGTPAYVSYEISTLARDWYDSLIEFSGKQNLTSKQNSKAMQLINKGVEFFFFNNRPDKGSNFKFLFCFNNPS